MISEERIKEVLIPVFMRQDQASIHWPDIFEEVRAIEAEVTVPLEAKIKQLEQANAELEGARTLNRITIKSLQAANAALLDKVADLEKLLVAENQRKQQLEAERDALGVIRAMKK